MSPQTTCEADLWWSRPSRSDEWHCFTETTNDEMRPEALCGDWKDHGWRKIPHREGLSPVENLHCSECATRSGMVTADPRVDVDLFG
jgi:hypothetical protein